VASESLTDRQKAAAFLVAIGPDRAATILSHLDEIEVESMAQEISLLGRVAGSTLDEVVDEFWLKLTSDAGGINFARTLLETWRGSHSEEMIQRLVDAAQNRPRQSLL
jgi:flagellar motor switch protein FliG